jgi:hypothetical protein
MVQKEIMKYISDNSTKIMNEIGILNKIKGIQGNFIIFVCAVLFLVGAYITYTTPSKPVLPEGFISVEPDAQAAHKLRTVAAAATAHTKSVAGTGGGGGTEPFDNASSPSSDGNTHPQDFASMNNDRCPNILIQHGSEIFLYNSKVEKVPGVNPIRFKSLDDYSEFMDWLQGRGIRCPVLFLQFSYDAQGQAVYKMRPSPTDLQGGLSPNVPYSPAPAALVQMMDASRDNPPFNNQMYDGFDPLNFNMGDYTAHDAAFREKELTSKYSDNPMDANWGGIRYTESVVNSGAYADRTRPDAARTSSDPSLTPMLVPGK